MKHWEGKAKWSLHQIICKEKTITLRLCTLKQHDVTSAPEQSSLLMVQCLVTGWTVSLLCVAAVSQSGHSVTFMLTSTYKFSTHDIIMTSRVYAPTSRLTTDWRYTQGLLRAPNHTWRQFLHNGAILWCLHILLEVFHTNMVLFTPLLLSDDFRAVTVRVHDASEPKQF